MRERLYARTQIIISNSLYGRSIRTYVRLKSGSAHEQKEIKWNNIFVPLNLFFSANFIYIILREGKSRILRFIDRVRACRVCRKKETKRNKTNGILKRALIYEQHASMAYPRPYTFYSLNLLSVLLSSEERKKKRRGEGGRGSRSYTVHSLF